MKTFSITCGILLAVACSLVALFRYWLIMTFGVGFAAIGDERLSVGAHASLMAGAIGLLLSLAMIIGYPMLSRRKVLPRLPLAVSPAGLRSA